MAGAALTILASAIAVVTPLVARAIGGPLGALILWLRLPVLARLVVEVELPVELLLSRQSFSAAMARSTPKPRATYDPVPRSS